jgi:low temperature requirement protein LtrA
VSTDDVEPAGGAPADPEHQEVERHASWAELFFDLVAVAAVGALAHVLAAELGWASLGLYAVLFLAVWLAWTTFMLYGNVAGSRTHVLRLLIGMFGLGVMAASVPGVTHTLLDGGHENRAVTAFTLAYVVTRVYGAQSWRRGEVLLDFPVAQHTVGVLPWVISLWTHPPVTVALWALGVALDLWLVLVVSGDDMLERAAARAEALTERESRGDAKARAADRAERRGGGRRGAGRARGPDAVRRVIEAVPVVTDPAHLAERLGLFVIIVLGEGVVQVVDAASGAVPETGLFLAGLASFVLLAGMFGLSVQYGFAGVPHLRADAVPARLGLALHCVVTGVIATVSVGLAAVVEHGNEPLDDGPRWLLCGAVAAYFLIGQLVAIVVAERSDAVRTLWISSGVVVPLLLGLVGTSLPASVLTGLIAAVVVGQVVVEARAERPATD